MNTALIITTYNRANALALVLKSVMNQSILPDEIIVVDDGSTDNTREVVSDFQKFHFSNLDFISIEHKNFRAALLRNEGIRNTSSDYLIFIDGDMILHRHFIKSHIKHAEKGRFLQGHRSMLSESKTKNIILSGNIKLSFFSDGLSNRKNSVHSFFLSELSSASKSNLKGIRTCNFSCYRTDAELVNGFDEDFVGWGREDSEFAARLINNGIQRFNLRFCAVQFHLDHLNNNKTIAGKLLEENDKRLQDTILLKKKYCKNGLKKNL